MKKNWYVIQVYSNFEKKVKDSLEKAIKSSKFEEKFGNILIPSEGVIEMREGQFRKTDRKFFPGYILIEMELNDDTWHLVRRTNRVLGFVGGTSKKPIHITEKEVTHIMKKIKKSTNKPIPKTLYEIGEVLRVIEGPFTDFDGVVEEVNYEKNRLKVLVSIFSRSTPVELNFSQVEKLQ